MAKKVVATLQKKGDDRAFSKVIKMVKSPKNGAYCFEETICPKEKAGDFLNS